MEMISFDRRESLHEASYATLSRDLEQGDIGFGTLDIQIEI